MIHPIVRMYASAPQAAAAIQELQNWGFLDDAIDLVGPSTGRPAGAAGAAAEDPLVAAIMAAYVVKSDAKIYAERVRQGGFLVIIRAPFGTCGIARGILNGQSPIASGVVEEEDHAAEWDEAAPLSSAIRFAPLLDGASGLSSFLSMPAICRRGRTLSSLLGLPELSGPASYLSSAIGMGLLSGKTAPLSDLLHIPLLFGTGSARA